jgi:hypothetical protein
MTISRIQELERLRFDWSCSNATCEDRLSELADYTVMFLEIRRKLQAGYVGDNPKEAIHVASRRKDNPLLFPRIQELESFGFE